MRSYTFLLAAAAAAAVAAPAAAAQAEAASVTVNTADLDLSSEQGAARLDRRIRTAAAGICGPLGSRSLAEFNSFETCRTQAITDAQGEVRTMIAAAKQSGVQMASRVVVRRK